MLQHVFVVDESGIPVYSRCIMHSCALGQLDAFAVSGLLTALNNFAKEIGVGDITSINVANSKLLMKNQKRYFATFQLGLQDDDNIYRTHLSEFGTFLNDIYPTSTPVSDELRSPIVQSIEDYLANHKYETPSTWGAKIRSFFSRLMGQK